ncbi:DUF3592 domain-containing protein [Streptomyces sp. NRRL B-3648]|uniref:DUF3592 domain-containing protein n=1 Tax=Streptomyces sp. NRRL B-3648 TaxID=1519493 RepID=UPI0006AF26AA|nr:DUF3592 domain-containing protein [Streptomyces sp. NRRL B-3648]KOV92830.1 hypothetical protein ADL04_29740 [Streptomyces sp. NRRL B-3648]
MERAWLFSLIPLTIGVVFLAFGVYGLRCAAVLRRTGVDAEARIVRHEARRNDEGVTFYHPVAAWTAQDGTAYEYASRYGRGTVRDTLGAGTRVLVRYDPRAPHRFAIQGWDMTRLDLLFTVLGSVLTTGTVTVLLVRLLTL